MNDEYELFNFDYGFSIMVWRFAFWLEFHTGISLEEILR
jgi:hypothetical protein